jgi:hypothetical protein
MPGYHIGSLFGRDSTISCIFSWISKFNLNKSRQQVSYLQKFQSEAAASMKINRVKLHDLSFAQRSTTEAFQSLIASEHHLDGGAKVFLPRFLPME